MLQNVTYKFQKIEIDFRENPQIFHFFQFDFFQNFPISAGISKKFAKIFNFSKNLRELPKKILRFFISKISEIHFLSPRYCLGKVSHYKTQRNPFRSNILVSENVSQIFWKWKICSKFLEIPANFLRN